MDTLVYIILICEAAFGLALLYFAGVLKEPKHVLISAVLLAAAFFLRVNVVYIILCAAAVGAAMALLHGKGAGKDA